MQLRPHLALISLSVLTTGVQGVTLVNASFEADDASGSPYYIRSATVPSGWTQFADGVDLIHDTYTQAPAVLVSSHTGSQFLDLNQAAAGGGLYQDVAVQSGQTYRLSFYTAQWATNSSGNINYQLINPANAQVLATNLFNVAGSSGWVERTVEATAISNTLRIQFFSSGESQAAPALDSVSLTVVPEPSAAIMCIGSFIFFLRRRRG